MFYYKIKRNLWVKGEKAIRFSARVFRGTDVSLDEIAKEISHSTTMSYPDVLAALKAFEIHISAHILNGSAVKFGTLGAFIPTLRSKACATAEEVTADTIKRVTCRFYPSVAFKNTMKGANLIEKDMNIDHA